MIRPGGNTLPAHADGRLKRALRVAAITALSVVTLLSSANSMVTPAALAARPPEPSDQPQTVGLCSTGGRSTLVSEDGSIAITVFPTMPANVQLTLTSRLPVNTIPAPPGIRVGGLVFRIDAGSCNGSTIDMLPAEINLGIRYSDLEATALNERRFFIARLDPDDEEWDDAIKLADDPGANYVSATIKHAGLYTVYFDVP
jgi:hypothetical protein